MLYSVIRVILSSMPNNVLSELYLNVFDSWFKVFSIQCIMPQSETF